MLTSNEEFAIRTKAKAGFRRIHGECYDGDEEVLEKAACAYADWKVEYRLNPPHPASFGPVEIGGNG